jgi:hypothetical protein
MLSELARTRCAGKIDLFDSYVMPISGTDFVRYIAMISFLAEHMRRQGLDPIKPKVIYAASGGCLAAYIAMMSSFTSRVEEWTFSSEMFIRRPTPFTPRLLTFAIKGYFYHRTDLTEYIKNAFIPCKLQDVEIVTGYYETIEHNTMRSVVKIVSNYPQSRSILTSHESSFMSNVRVIHPEENPLTKYGLTPASLGNESVAPLRPALKKYLDDLTNLISDALHKTTNIPLMMEPLGESLCIDYGVIAPSPRAVTRGDPNRSIYFSPIDPDRIAIIKEGDMIFHQYILNDIFLLTNQFPKTKKFNKTDPHASFKETLSFISTLTRYCLVIYSVVETNIPIESFADSMVKDTIKLCKTGLRFMVLHE